MSAVKVRLSIGSLLLFGIFALLSTPQVFLAVLLTIAVHEAGHCAMLRLLGGKLCALSASAMGLEMKTQSRLSYFQEVLALISGPMSNVVMFFVFGLVGRLWEGAYLFGGAQLLLGVFNLLPISGLDGGDILWIILAVCTNPYTADRLSARTAIAFSTALVLFAAGMVCKIQRGILLLWTAMGLLLNGLRQIGLVKWAGKG